MVMFIARRRKLNAAAQGRNWRAFARRWVGAVAACGVLASAPTFAADGVSSINGQVLGAGAPVAGSAVTLWGASAGAAKPLGQAQAGAGGRFVLNATGAAGDEASLYLVAKGGRPAASKVSGDNPAIALL